MFKRSGLTMEEWAPEPFNLTKEPILQSNIELALDPGFSGNFPRAAKWCDSCARILGLDSFSLFKGLQMGR